MRPNGGQLRAKVFLFWTLRAMRAHWARRFLPIKRNTHGVVNSLVTWREGIGADSGSEYRRIAVDARYFCAIGLSVTALTHNIIAHESVHAAFAFSRRKARAWWDDAIDEDSEERIAYPAGIIANAIVRTCERYGHQVKAS